MDLRVDMTADAWIKTQLLIHGFDTEVEWYGLVDRIDDDHILIYDILNYPQTVTRVSVRGDNDQHQKWLFSLQDEQLKHLRMHGHSHVNMDISPSETDLRFQEDMAKQCPENDMYLFMIFNKRGNIYIRFCKGGVFAEYDTLYMNVVFEDRITTDAEFLNEAYSMAKQNTEQEREGNGNEFKQKS